MLVAGSHYDLVRGGRHLHGVNALLGNLGDTGFVVDAEGGKARDVGVWARGGGGGGQHLPSLLRLGLRNLTRDALEDGSHFNLAGVEVGLSFIVQVLVLVVIVEVGKVNILTVVDPAVKELLLGRRSHGVGQIIERTGHRNLSPGIRRHLETGRRGVSSHAWGAPSGLRLGFGLPRLLPGGRNATLSGLRGGDGGADVIGRGSEAYRRHIALIPLPLSLDVVHVAAVHVSIVMTQINRGG
mmetsp:Transcript_24605/g.48918  ORF Transcript_24605/g.48918 Transcript_24605/m.48918 type:complete len:240 (-) Transcript_24605:160-879(-)